MSYTLQQMVDVVSVWLPDVNVLAKSPLRATPEYVVRMLNRAQDTVLSLIDQDYFQDLYTVQTGLTLTTSSYTLSGLTKQIFHETAGVIGVELSTGDVLCDILTPKEYLSLRHQAKVFVTSKPACYFQGGKVYILPTTYDGTIDIHYMRAPDTMAWGEGEASDTSCELADEVQEIILDCVMYEILKYRTDPNDINRSTVAYNAMVDRINMINKTINPENIIDKGLARTAGDIVSSNKRAFV